ncbi:MAG: ABC transporter ATP-binding protein [Candidatus Saccharibacteria bacterium]|nr:ABC transporter ATP-binding protein [Candidatus Saccharibacteria bacterium]
MLQIKDLTKQFQSGNGQMVTVLDDMDAEFGEGDFVSIVGKSGSGKSTLLSLLGSLDRPTSGSILLDDQDITKLKGDELTDYRCRQIGFVFQNYQLVPNLTAMENVCLAMEFAGMSRESRERRAKELLNEVGIGEERCNSLPGKMSGGEQQRVSIARALANKPSIILADEPTGNLDEETGKKVLDLLRNLSKEENVTIIVVTHDMDIARHSDYYYRLKGGKLTRE